MDKQINNMELQDNRINLNPKIWGSKGWFFLDSIVLSYPVNPTYEQRQSFKLFFTMIGDMIPCMKCRYNYKMHLNKFPITENILSSNNTLLSWWLSIHNEARKSMGNQPYSMKDFKIYYNEVYEDDSNLLHYSKIHMQVLIVLSVMILFIIIKKGINMN